MRYPEIDVLRTVAIVQMIVYHLLFDLTFLYGFPFDLSTVFWHVFQVSSASLFLVLAGVSFVLSYQRVATRQTAVIFRKYVLRGLRIVGCGIIISVVTYIFDAHTFVRFGILHLIGISILFLPGFYRLKELNLLLGVLFIIIGQYTSTLIDQSSFLLPFGVRYAGFETIDYFPLFPWSGVILIGVAVGHCLFVRYPYWRTASLDQLLRHRSVSIIGIPGRNSLLLYLVHQPLIILVLSLMYGTPSLRM